jgi:hypothetical protein
MSSTLREIRGWLERNRAEVLVIVLESSVEPSDVENEFESAGLARYLSPAAHRGGRRQPPQRAVGADPRLSRPARSRAERDRGRLL